MSDPRLREIALQYGFSTLAARSSHEEHAGLDAYDLCCEALNIAEGYYSFLMGAPTAKHWEYNDLVLDEDDEPKKDTVH